LNKKNCEKKGKKSFLWSPTVLQTKGEATREVTTFPDRKTQLRHETVARGRWGLQGFELFKHWKKKTGGLEKAKVNNRTKKKKSYSAEARVNRNENS